MMDAETWMNAKKALEMGFCDEVLYQPVKIEAVSNSFAFSRRAITNSLMIKMRDVIPKTLTKPSQEPPDNNPTLDPNARVNASDLQKRLARFQFV